MKHTQSVVQHVLKIVRGSHPKLTIILNRLVASGVSQGQYTLILLKKQITWISEQEFSDSLSNFCKSYRFLYILDAMNKCSFICILSLV